MKAAFVTILFSLFVSHDAFAHGMNKPGPNNGYIKMPGAYHIELVESSDGYKIYLHDMSFKKLPITKGSAALTLKGVRDFKISCIKMDDYFQCDTKSVNLKIYKAVVVESSQKGERIASSKYSFPLKY